MDDIKEVFESILHMLDDKPETLTQVERVLRLIYMSETGELEGANSSTGYEFTNCKIVVFYGRN